MSEPFVDFDELELMRVSVIVNSVVENGILRVFVSTLTWSKQEPVLAACSACPSDRYDRSPVSLPAASPAPPLLISSSAPTNAMIGSNPVLTSGDCL